MKKVIVSVINDLVTDQRVHKVCNTLTETGFEVLLIGRKLNHSFPVENRAYRTLRMKLLFEKGFLFYAEYNIRLFLFLLFRRADIYHANDLDTLLPNFLISRLKNKTLVYDSHEYFCYVPELIGRPRVQNAWLRIERWIFPKLKYVFTVNNSIGQLYKKHYCVEPVVLLNAPSLEVFKNIPSKSKEELGLPASQSVIILQGSGININRGAEEAIEAMQYIDNAVLLIIGGGDVMNKLKNSSEKLGLGNKIIFKDKMHFPQLIQYTRCADVGITLDKAENPNYRYSLPNKLFDYIHAGIPVLSSPLVEIKKIYSRFNIGEMIDNHDPDHISGKLRYMIENKEMQVVWRQNAHAASMEYNWENESRKLVQVYEGFQ